MNWTGSYIGISGGGVWGNAKVHNGTTGADETPWFSLNGGLIGVTAGSQFQTGNWVLGVEGDTSVVGANGSAYQLAPNVGFNSEVKERWLSTYRGRVRRRAGQLAVLRDGRRSAREPSAQHHVACGVQFSETQWHWGWAVGAGVEVQAQPGLVGEGGIPVPRPAG